MKRILILLLTFNVFLSALADNDSPSGETLNCAENEYQDNCPVDCKKDYCPKQLSDDTDPCPSPPSEEDCPPPACKCGIDYRRADNGSCILTTECPPFDCPDNQEYNSCPAYCPTDDCADRKYNGICPFNIKIRLICNPKCSCKPGYWRLNGTCVPEEQCPPICGDNEVLDNCPADCPRDKCPTSANQNQTCETPEVCPPPACKCKFNYRRAENGTCIPTKDCPPFDCKKHEKYTACPPLCPSDGCSSKDLNGICPYRIGIVNPCTPACRCEEGYFRDDKGDCIPKDQCPLICGDNEVVDNCPADCPRDKCPTSANQNQTCETPEVCPPPACKCKFNYRRAENGTCIPTKDCPPFDCKKHEKYTACPPLCPSDGCSSKDLNGICPYRIGIVNPCTPACRCEEGYFRDDKGDCIPKDQCPLTCGKNEVVDNCPADCPRDKCPTSANQNQTCETPEVCPPPACKCKFNYRRAENGTCIPTKDCPPFDCKKHEKYTACPPLCPSDGCSSKDLNGICPYRIGIVNPCTPACRCEEGYFRDDKGDCIPKDQCPLTCGKNEVVDNCPADCPRDKCPTSANQNQTCETPEVCPPPACKCKFNYRRAENGTCIPTKDCPPFDCKKHEKYTACPPLCPSDGCSSKDLNGICPYRIGIVNPCTPACRCEEGYFRDDKGDCIPKDQCPLICGDNEVVDNCPADCPRDKCPTSANQNQTCETPEVCPPPACKCKFNYRRAENGTCIPTKDCPPFDCKKHEKYTACPPLCPSDGCSSKDLNGICPYRIGIVNPCTPACRCEEGYFRDDKGDCIPKDQCPLVCPRGEIKVDCPADCATDKCPKSAADEKTKCPKPDPCPKPACKCPINHRRADNGTCILTKQCPKFDCPENEKFVACPAWCPTDGCESKKLNGKCPYSIKVLLICKPACRCVEGYFRQDGVCIPADECPCDDDY